VAKGARDENGGDNVWGSQGGVFNVPAGGVVFPEKDDSFFLGAGGERGECLIAKL